MMQPRIAIGICLAVAGLALGGCGQASESSSPPATSKPASRPSLDVKSKDFRLTWEIYDGTGERERAEYLIGSEHLGRGAVGLKAVRKRIMEMPPGSNLLIEPYYGDPGGGVKREYPFDVGELGHFAQKYGVTLQVPSAG